MFCIVLSLFVYCLFSKISLGDVVDSYAWMTHKKPHPPAMLQYLEEENKFFLFFFFFPRDLGEFFFSFFSFISKPFFVDTAAPGFQNMRN